MDQLAFPIATTSVKIASDDRFLPVRRIYCVGRNYAEHAREMGKDPIRDAPFFFMKPSDALVASGVDIPYPPRTTNFHHEIELVVAIGKSGLRIPLEDALDHVFGYAVGNDYTRRDLQLAARDKGRPWDTGKGFDQSAAISPLHLVSDVGHITRGDITLSVNDHVKQRGDIGDLIWKVPEIIVELSTFFELKPGDLIYTGTPAGVGPVNVGDFVTGRIEGLGEIHNTIVSAK